MKFSVPLLLASFISAASAFSAVAPSNGAATGTPAPVDKTMRGIDSEEATFDPTTGDNPALQRNNNDEVWVPQVRFSIQLFQECKFLAI